MTERTFDDVLQELISLMDNPVDSFITKQEEVDIAQGLAQVRGLPEFLRKTLGSDMRRYFSASPAEQERIKGAFKRTVYFLGLSVPKKNLDHMKNKLSGNRKSAEQLQDV